MSETGARSVRSRNPSVKGRLYKLEVSKKSRVEQEKKVKRHLNHLESYVAEHPAEPITNELETLDKLFNDYLVIHSECQKLMETDEERQADDDSIDSLDRRVISLKRKVYQIKSETYKSASLTASHHDQSKSSKASKSSKGRSLKSVESEIALERARLAELKVEADYLQQKQVLEAQSRNLELREKLAKAEAKLKVYKESCSLGDNSEIVLNLPSLEGSDRKVKEYVDLHNHISQRSKQELLPAEEVVMPKHKTNENDSFTPKNELSQLLRYLQAPYVDIDTFSGDLIEYQYFITTFVETVETKIDDPKGRLTRLLKYLSGEAKELVKGCICLSADEGYKEARRLLDKHYGDPVRIVSAYRKELKERPQLKAHDGQDFRKFFCFLLKLQSSLKCSSRTYGYDNPDLLQSLQMKLPPFLQERWNRKILHIRKKNYREATLNDFIEFFDDETSLVNDPTYSKNALSNFKVDQRSSFVPARKSLKSMYASAKEEKCKYCEKLHDIEKCTEYLKLSLGERRTFVFRNRLCFSCLGSTNSDHSAKTCKERRTCRKCKEFHPTSLHGYRDSVARHDERRKNKEDDKGKPKISSDTITSGCTKLKEEVISLNVVPIIISHPSSSSKLETYALLDNGSQGTFIRDDLLQRLRVPSNPATITIKTITGEETQRCRAVNNLLVSSTSTLEFSLVLPKTYSRPILPVDEEEVPTPRKVEQWKYLDKIHQFLPSDKVKIEIGVLIGGNCPKALEPVEMIPSQGNGPYALRTILGWCVTGPIRTSNGGSTPSKQACHLVAVDSSVRFTVQNELKDRTIEEMMLAMFSQDFSENQPQENQDVVMMSQEDFEFMKLMDKENQFIDGHHCLPLPLRSESFKFPNNRKQAVQRAESLKRKLNRNHQMYNDYKEFINSIIKKGYAEKVNHSSVTEGKTWYIPHHGVYHSKKPNSIRVVFDCSTSYQGISLNSQLLQGPDLTNQIIGVLTRFREDYVPIVGDIEKMFYQVRVPKDQRNLLRFVWWPDGDLSKSLVDYQMCVHLFGGTHSPSTANYALRKTAKDNVSKFGKAAADTLIKNFYVDDMLKSVGTPEEAVQLLNQVTNMCAAGGFKLTKFTSSSREVVKSFQDEDKSKGIKDLDLSVDSLPVERALGVCWCVENDMFSFRIVIKDQPLTRRGILSSISSVYDPLGFAAPFLLPGKRLLQQICSDKKGWDEEVTPDQKNIWDQWKRSLPILESVTVPRCFKPENFGKVIDASLHHFADACCTGYGVVSYLRLVDQEGMVHCSFLLGKARVAPIKPTTVPRLELTAATAASKVAVQLRKELEIPLSKEVFWTDSQVVLGYIRNVRKKFHMFVANRIQIIHSFSSIDQWRYVSTKDNPADEASRGQKADQFVKNTRWLKGPDFLWKQIYDDSSEPIFDVNVDDPEVKREVKVNATKVEGTNLLSRLLELTSNWYRVKRIVATILCWRSKTKKIDVDMMCKSQTAILKLVQYDAFRENFSKILRKLDPFLDQNGLIRAGGRLKNSNMDDRVKYPIIIPKNGQATSMIIRWYHEKIRHGGRGMTLNELRQQGLLIINANSRVRHIISKCVVCRSLRGKVGEQQMSSLPEDRFQEAPPFTYSAVDMFGPFLIKERRSELKRYCALFTCMASRAVNIEVTSTLSTDSFIMALRRFSSRRGEVRQLRSDNGTNFTGANIELHKAIQEMDQHKISNFLLKNGTDWLTWEFNPPKASHMGGIWERQIRSARSILASILRTHGNSLNEESFRTYMAEVESVINSRPLSVDVVSDSASLAPITPNSILTMKSKITMPPPGVFESAEVYSKRHWRRIQHLINEFWTRWRHEYLQNLQIRRKWQTPRRNFMLDDVVLLKDEATRCDWRMARVINVHRDESGCVRHVTVRTSSQQELVRPIQKLVLLVESPLVDSSKSESPLVDSSKSESPLVDSSMSESLLVDSSKSESPLVDSSKFKSPLGDSSKSDSPLVDSSTLASPLSRIQQARIACHVYTCTCNHGSILTHVYALEH